MTTTVPRLSIGLPVYNGEQFLAQAVDSLLGQSYTDFELILADNASTDATEKICRTYAAADDRVRYIRRPRNLGSAVNHNLVFAESRGELFKWAASDDLYASTLLESCVAALDQHPEVVAAHAFTTSIDNAGREVERLGYHLATSSPDPVRRFRSLLFDEGGDDAYAVVRAWAMRKALPHGSYYRADRTFVASLALQGPFHQTADWLYFRRDHPDRASRRPTVREWCAAMDPRRADRLRHPMVRLVGEYVGGFLTGIRRAPLTPRQRLACSAEVVRWLASRTRPGALNRSAMPGREGAWSP